MPTTTLRPACPLAARLLALRAALLDAGTVACALHADSHARVAPLSTVRVTTHLGSGELRSVTDDGWVAVRLDGELRVDEYPVELVQLEA